MKKNYGPAHHTMTLKSKVLLILAGVFILYGAIDYGIQHVIIFPSFLKLEDHEVRQNLERVVQAIKSEIQHIDLVCHDWSAWDDTYNFVLNGSDAYIESNLAFSTFFYSKTELIYICDTEGRVVWGQIYDLNTEKTIQLAEFPKDTIPKKHPLFQYSKELPLSDAAVKGIFMTERGPMQISARPILTTGDKGPARGFFIMGRLLNEDVIKPLGQQIRVNFQIFTMSDLSSDRLKNIFNRMKQSPY